MGFFTSNWVTSPTICQEIYELKAACAKTIKLAVVASCSGCKRDRVWIRCYRGCPFSRSGLALHHYTTELGQESVPELNPPRLVATNRHVSVGEIGAALELHHLQLTPNGPRCVRVDLQGIKSSGYLDACRHHHIPGPMLQEGILCRLNGTVFTATVSLLGLPLGVPSARRSQRSPRENPEHRR